MKNFKIRLVKISTDDLKVLFELSYRWHDEELIAQIKREFKKRGVLWNK